jgi:WD40 repeat protein
VLAAAGAWQETQHGAPVQALAALEPTGVFAVGLFSGAIDLVGAPGSRRLEGHGGGVTALAWLSSRRWLASGAVDADVVVWRLGVPVAELGLARLEAAHAALQAVRPGELTHAEMTAHFEQMDRVAREFGEAKQRLAAAVAASVGPHGQGGELRLAGHADAIRALCWAGGDRELLASGSLDGTVRVWDLAAARPGEAVAVLDRHTGPVTALAAGGGVGDGAGAWLAMGSADSSIIVWELATMRPAASRAQCHGLGVCALAWLPARELLASGSADTTVKLWWLPEEGGRTLRAVWTLCGHTDVVRALPAMGATHLFH